MASLPNSMRVVVGAIRRARHVLLAWLFVNMLCGGLYYIITTNSPLNGLIGARGGTANTLLDGIYYSFITTASVGLGDIVPQGASKIITILQALIGLLVLTLLISEILHGEEGDLIKKIHSYSSSGRVKRIRSGFYFFRENVEETIDKVKRKEIKQTQMQNYINLHLMSLATTLSEIKALYQEDPHLKKTELEEGKMAMHMLLSLLSLKSAMKFLKKKKIIFTTQTKKGVQNIIGLSQEVLQRIGSSIETVNKKQLKDVAETLGSIVR